MSSLILLRTFFRGKKVFLTGHTGFKGSYLALWLRKLGAQISGYSLAPHPKQPFFNQLGIEKELTHYVGDITHREYIQKVLIREQPDMVIHCAAQALVREGYRDPLGTFMTNSIGTLYVLEALRYLPSCKAALFITTDKVYDPAHGGQAHVEQHPLKGEDPYSGSKVCAEQIVHTYVRSRLVPLCNCATARAGNVIGGGDRAADRLIPDIVRAWESGEPLRMRHPSAIRPWQHVLEPLMGYLQLLMRLYESHSQVSAETAWNFGPPEKEMISVKEIVQKAEGILNTSFKLIVEPSMLSETHVLRLNSRKAEQSLSWKSLLSIEEALKWTFDWYRMEAQGEDMRKATEQQIDHYMQLALQVGASQSYADTEVDTAACGEQREAGKQG